MNFIRLIILLIITGCGISNPFSDNISYKERFDEGLKHFEAEKYIKSSQQFNIIVQRASHTDLGDDALFFLAESYFKNKDYDLALIEYEKLVSRMGFSPYIEKSRWRICESLTFLSPNYYHDQQSSLKAISQIQEFIDDFPLSDFSEDANLLLNNLRERLAMKDMETGKLYMKLKAYDSAILSFTNVIEQYYDTAFFKNANLEIIRCYVFLGEKDKAKEFFEELEKEKKSVLTNSFKKEALSIMDLSSK